LTTHVANSSKPQHGQTSADPQTSSSPTQPSYHPTLTSPVEVLTIADVASSEIDDYLSSLEEPKRSTLSQLRDTIVAIVPDADQGISYGVPAFRLEGKTIGGFAAFKNHLSYLPHSGRVIGRLERDTEGYTKTKGSLHFGVDEPLPEGLVRKLLNARIAEALGPRP
jgi:uncharacterized protein YdhG (YjbR/CyaY superfamily)